MFDQESENPLGITTDITHTHTEYCPHEAVGRRFTCSQ